MAVKGKKREELTIENILKKISEYDIYRYYLGKDFAVPYTTNSPFREDKTPSFFIGNKGGFLHHTDLADSRWKGNCVQFVEQLFNLNFHDSLIKIDHDLGTGIASTNSIHYSRVTKEHKQPDLPKEGGTLIQVKTKPMDASDLAYWASFHITPEQLRRHNVYSIKQLWLNRQKLSIGRTELVFGYFYDEKWKIYRPFGDKKSKWISNVPGNHIEGLKNIKGCESAIITKSKKDLMVLEQVFPCVCAVQSESTGALTEESIAYLKSNAKNIYTNFDCDEAGKKNSWYYTQDFGFKHINVPDVYYQKYGIKDFAGVAQKEGLNVIREYLKEKNIL